jgi:hypothetical protein
LDLQVRHDFEHHTLVQYANDAWADILSKSVTNGDVIDADMVSKWAHGVAKLTISDGQSLFHVRFGFSFVIEIWNA